jgi:uncharacterized membrane-anchored protein YhcB (DUF1043 family)
LKSELDSQVEELSHHFYEEPEDLIRDIEEYVDFFQMPASKVGL